MRALRKHSTCSMWILSGMVALGLVGCKFFDPSTSLGEDVVTAIDPSLNTQQSQFFNDTAAVSTQGSAVDTEEYRIPFTASSDNFTTIALGYFKELHAIPRLVFDTTGIVAALSDDAQTGRRRADSVRLKLPFSTHSPFAGTGNFALAIVRTQDSTTRFDDSHVVDSFVFPSTSPAVYDDGSTAVISLDSTKTDAILSYLNESNDSALSLAIIPDSAFSLASFVCQMNTPAAPRFSLERFDSITMEIQMRIDTANSSPDTTYDTAFVDKTTDLDTVPRLKRCDFSVFDTRSTISGEAVSSSASSRIAWYRLSLASLWDAFHETGTHDFSLVLNATTSLGLDSIATENGGSYAIRFGLSTTAPAAVSIMDCPYAATVDTTDTPSTTVSFDLTRELNKLYLQQQPDSAYLYIRLGYSSTWSQAYWSSTEEVIIETYLYHEH